MRREYSRVLEIETGRESVENTQNRAKRVAGGKGGERGGRERGREEEEGRRERERALPQPPPRRLTLSP
eukprot:scaffold13321_cov20-Tisochrysis_lutea.AAC.1